MHYESISIRSLSYVLLLLVACSSSVFAQAQREVIQKETKAGAIPQGVAAVVLAHLDDHVLARFVRDHAAGSVEASRASARASCSDTARRRSGFP